MLDHAMQCSIISKQLYAESVAAGGINGLSSAVTALTAAVNAGERAKDAAGASGKGTQQAAIFTGQAASYTVVALIDTFLNKRSFALAAAAAAGERAPFVHAAPRRLVTESLETAFCAFYQLNTSD